jgi:hypothetical protein
MLKNIVVSWYGEINLKILKEKPIKSIRIKARLSVPIMYPWGTKILRNKKKIISKGLLKTRSNSDPSKVHNHHLVNVSQNKISQLTLLFHSSTCV